MPQSVAVHKRSDYWSKCCAQAQRSVLFAARAIGDAAYPSPEEMSDPELLELEEELFAFLELLELLEVLFAFLRDLPALLSCIFGSRASFALARLRVAAALFDRDRSRL